VDEKTIDERTLDANAVAGMLEALFGADMTTADSRCAACAREGEVGTLRAFTSAPGVVLRCPACDAVMLRIVETPRGVLFEATGLAFLRVPR
jgi:predicted nucleic acid-binding Zn ribbon protein